MVSDNILVTKLSPKEVGIDRVLALGNRSEPLCQIPIGLNPVAAAVEAEIEIENVAESGLIDFERLYSLWEL